MNINSVAVLGGGNGAHAFAADLALRGYEVSMFELPRFAERFRPTLEMKSIKIAPVFGPEIAEKFKVPNFFTDYRKALKLKPDLVSVCTPNALHARQTIDSLKSMAPEPSGPRRVLAGTRQPSR